ncbi:MAG: cell surface protein SprA [Gemmatimonadales bacterium]
MTRSLAAAFAALLLVASEAPAQQPAPLPPLRQVRLESDSLRGSLRITQPTGFPVLVLPGGLGAARAADRWADSARARAAGLDALRWRALVLGDSATLARLPGPETTLVALPLAYGLDQGASRPVSIIGRYADLGIQLNALFELRYDQLKNLRCTASDAGLIGSGCQSGFTPPRIDPQFQVRTGGVVGQRIHVNVDYDTQREFDASNNIQVYYQGLEDEVLRRVEVGNVTFQAPRSRFITGGIPANNFGVAAQGALGALTFGALFAQQKGNVAKARVFNVGDQTVQPVDRVLADRDFEPTRFFFVRNPRTIPGYPALDILNLTTTGLPDSLRITQVRIYRHRSTIGPSSAGTNLAGIPAVALRKDSQQRVGPINWEVMVEGRDYYLDPSGMWFALALRLDQQDYLAVSYITARGDTVGTFPAASRAGRTDTLELIFAPQSGPDVPTFYYELRNVYRVGSSDDVTRTSVGVQVLVAGSQRPAAAAPTFLSLLGLALESDATTFDQFNRLFPRSRDPAGGAPLRELFVVFPSIRPFADSTRLAAAYRTDSLYHTPTYLLRTQGPSPLFQIALHYDAKGGDNRSTLTLGGYQIRQGSERVTAAGRSLTRNVDYTINYEIGQITFVSPDSLFSQPTQVTVQFEENQAFAVAPTSLYGVTTTYDLGDHGSINALGLFQQQSTTFTRPPLGFEPASNFVGGVTGNFRFEPRLTQLLNAIPFVHTEAPSSLTLDAEVATSRPSPNRVGVAYVETFEGTGGIFLPLNEGSWEYGSRPSSTNGVAGTGIDPGIGFNDADAVALTWQNLIPASAGGAFQLRSQDIDPSIVVQGATQNAETVLWLALHPDTVGGLPDPRTFNPRWLLPHNPAHPRWRTMSQALSATGIDLSRIEYLEFWVLEDDAHKLRNAGASFLFDFGTVYEDAVDFLPTRFTTSGADTTYTGRRRVGEGRLDTERDTLTGAFNAAVNDNGILGDVADSIVDGDNGMIVRNMPLCNSALGQSLVVYDWGSFFPRCTRHNGRVDTEDLNNDQHLDTLIAATGEHHFRYTFKVGDPRYLVRDGGTIPGVGQWHLYRIPFRADTFQVGTPDIRQVRALRMTVIAPATAAAESTLFFALARMQLVGAPWVKRAGTPIPGISGLTGATHGEVIASIVSTENKTDLGYESPPGVIDQGQTVTGSLSLGSTQINEQSLRVVASDLRAGERAEAFLSFPDQPKNFLGYRQLRVWARGRGVDWDLHRLSFYIKAGQDANNFYMYRTNASSTTWLPEVVVDFQPWFLLRAQIEKDFLEGKPPSGAAQCGGDTLAYVACSGPYLVHVLNPAVSPPNLTQVQELAVGFVRDSGVATDSAEVWVDDIRLSGVVNDAGYAGAVSLDLTAADVATLNVQVSQRDGNFRQLGENPSYVGTNQFGLGSSIRLDKLGLERLGLTAPLTIRLDQTSQDPYFLTGTDVLTSGLVGLRKPSTSSASYALSIRRSRRGTLWWQRAFTDNLGFSAAWSSGSSRAELSTATSHVSDLRADYNVAPRELSFRYLPAFLRGALDRLPGFLRSSDLVRGLRDGRLRFTPASFAFSTGIARSSSQSASYIVPIATAFDVPAPVLSTTAVLRSTGSLELRPFTSMSLGFSASWDRDLKDYGDTTTIGVVTHQSGQRFLGMNIGFVRQRSASARFAWSPAVATWIRPRVTYGSSFTLNRDPNATQPERSVGDTSGAYRLPTTFGNAGTLDLAASLDLSRGLRNLLGDSSALRRALDRITQVDVDHLVDRRSQFNGPGFDPGNSYMFGLGGLGGYTSQNGRLADAASQSEQNRASMAFRLPLSVQLTGSYAQRIASSWFLRGDAQQLQRSTDTEWPNLAARWLWTPHSALIQRLITSISASAGWQLRSTVSEVPPLDAATGGISAVQETRSRPFSVTISWAPRITTGLARTSDHSSTDQSGNTTLSDRTSTTASLSFVFRTPQDLVPLKSPIRTSMHWSRSLNAICIDRADGTGCIPIADSRRTEYNLTMDTEMPPQATASLAASYVITDERQLDQKFSQFTLTASVRVFFNAGQVR